MVVLASGYTPETLNPPRTRGSEPRLAHKPRRGSPCRMAGAAIPWNRGVHVTLALLLRCLAA